MLWERTPAPYDQRVQLRVVWWLLWPAGLELLYTCLLYQGSDQFPQTDVLHEAGGRIFGAYKVGVGLLARENAGGG